MPSKPVTKPTRGIPAALRKIPEAKWRAWLEEMAQEIEANGGRTPHRAIPGWQDRWNLSLPQVNALRRMAGRAVGHSVVKQSRVVDVKSAGAPVLQVTVAQLEVRRQATLVRIEGYLADAATDHQWPAVARFCALAAQIEGVDQPLPVYVPAEDEAAPDTIEAALSEHYRALRIERQRCSLARNFTGVAQLMRQEADTLHQLITLRQERSREDREGQGQGELVTQLIEVLRDLPPSLQGQVFAGIADAHAS